jgi:hypothetical protein
MKRQEYILDIEERGNGIKARGYSIRTNHHLPSLSLTKDNAHVLFCQGDDAQSIIDEVPDDINEELFLLVFFDSAGVIK